MELQGSSMVNTQQSTPCNIGIGDHRPHDVYCEWRFVETRLGIGNHSSYDFCWAWTFMETQSGKEGHKS